MIENGERVPTKQERVADWMRVVFDAEVIANIPERVLRAAEEVIELVQASGVASSSLHRLVDYVFERPVGDPAKEIAGSLVTLYAVASAMGVDADYEFEEELARIADPSVIERVRRRQQEKREATALPQDRVAPEATEEEAVEDEWSDTACDVELNQQPRNIRVRLLETVKRRNATIRDLRVQLAEAEKREAGLQVQLEAANAIARSRLEALAPSKPKSVRMLGELGMKAEPSSSAAIACEIASWGRYTCRHCDQPKSAHWNDGNHLMCNDYSNERFSPAESPTATCKHGAPNCTAEHE